MMRSCLVAWLLVACADPAPGSSSECDPDAGAVRVEVCECDGGRGYGPVSVCGEWPVGTGNRWHCKCKP